MSYDLHTHSHASDGVHAPAEVVAMAAAAGLSGLALTDHDTAAGWDEAEAAAYEHGITLVRGIEISTRLHGHSVHLHGYLVDPGHPTLAALLQDNRDERRTRAELMLRRLDAGGYDLDGEAVLADGGATVGRPHVARALVAKGYAADVDHAFRELLHPGSPYYVGHLAPEPALVCSAVRAAGGVPVLAHPRGDKRYLSLDDEAVAQLTGAGLLGLEVDHLEHDAAAVSALAELAERLGLLRTGGSDFHGLATKPHNPLGARTTGDEVVDAMESLATGMPVLRP